MTARFDFYSVEFGNELDNTASVSEEVVGSDDSLESLLADMGIDSESVTPDDFEIPAKVSDMGNDGLVDEIFGNLVRENPPCEAAAESFSQLLLDELEREPRPPECDHSDGIPFCSGCTRAAEQNRIRERVREQVVAAIAENDDDLDWLFTPAGPSRPLEDHEIPF